MTISAQRSPKYDYFGNMVGAMPGRSRHMCEDCSAFFPVGQESCHMCGGLPARPASTRHDNALNDAYQSRERLPRRLRIIPQDNRWDMVKMRERVAALEAEEREAARRDTRRDRP